MSNDRFLTGLPPKAAAAVERGRERLRAGDDAGALAEFDRASAHNNAGVHRLRVEPLLRLGREAEAVESAHASLDAHPESHDGFVLLLYHLEGMKAAEGRGGETDLLVAAARRAAKKNPKTGWPRAVEAALLGTSRLQLAPLKAAVRLDPRRAWIWAFLGRALGNEDVGRPAEALKALTAALKLAPRAGWIYCWRAEVLKKLGRGAEALRDLDAGLRLQPGYHLGRAWRAQLRAERGDDKGAVEDLTLCYEHTRRPNFLEQRARRKAAAGDAAGALADAAECARVSWLHALGAGPMSWTAELKRLPHQPPRPLGRARWRWRKWRRAGSPAAGPGFTDSRPPAGWRPDENVLAKAPKPWAALWRGLATLEGGKPDAALPFLDAAAKSLPNIFAARLWRGRARLASGDARAAAADFDAAVGLAPKSAAALSLRGAARLQCGRKAEGINDLLAAARGDALNAPVLGVWLRALGLASKSRRPARGPLAEAAEVELLYGNPAGARRLAARLPRSAHAAAVEGWARAALALPAAPALSRAVARDAAAASDLLTSFFSRLPALPSGGAAAVYAALAEADGSLGRWEDRLRHRLLAVALDPRSPRPAPGAPAALAAKAQSLAAKNPVSAWAAMEKALAADPTAASARELLGEGPASGPAWALAWRGARRRAEGRLDEALKDFNASSSLFWSRAWRAELALVRGDANAALPDLEAALARHPRWGQARSWLAHALAALGRWERGAEEARAALSLDKRDPWAAVALGLCLQGLGKTKEGAAWISRGRGAILKG